MKFVSFPVNKKSRLLLFPLILLMFALTVFPQTQPTPPQLSLADILIALRSKKATLEEKNKILAEAVRQRGITFALTPEIEKELNGTGASADLVSAIRLKSPAIKPVATPVVVKPTPQPTPSASDIQRRANLNVANGEFDLAIADYNKVIEMKSADSITYLNRGLAYSNKKNYEQAIADYDKSIKLNPKDLMAYLNRADANEKIGNIEKAVSDYQKAVDLDNENATAQNNLKRLQDEIAKANEKAQPQPAMANQQTKENTPTTSKPSQMVNLGALNSLAVNLVVPVYPPIAQKSKVQGKVTVQVILDEEGKVVSAKAVEGPSLLRATSEDAIRKSKFKPAMVAGQAVKSTGFITYNFKGME